MFIFVVAGFLSAILSLVASMLLDPWINGLEFFDSVIPGLGDKVILLSLVLIEELSKFLLIYLSLRSFFIQKKLKRTLLAGILFGTGFFFFEVNLMMLNYGAFYIQMLFPFGIHVASSITLFGIFPDGQIERFSKLRFTFFFLLALAIHLCYNLFVNEKYF